jgi:hypothetical protein
MEGNPNAIVDDGSCIYTPIGFEFQQSTLQAFYFFVDATIDETPLVEMEDWIGIFYGSTCIGSWPWQGAYTTVPSMGDDGSEWTEGYINVGAVPSFKIFDGSEGELLNAFPSEEYSWGINEFFTIDLLDGMIFSTYTIDLHEGANLISFYALPEDASVENVFSGLGTNISGVIGEGVASQQISPDFWVGSLDNIETTSGYWVKVNEADVLDGMGLLHSLSPNIQRSFQCYPNFQPRNLEKFAEMQHLHLLHH